MKPLYKYLAAFMGGALTACLIYVLVSEYERATRPIYPGTAFPAIWADRYLGKRHETWHLNEEVHRKIDRQDQRHAFNVWLQREGVQLTSEELDRLTAD